MLRFLEKTLWPPERLRRFSTSESRLAVTPAVLVILMLLSGPVSGLAQQSGDAGFQFEIERPEWAAGAGPLVVVDGGHGNFHTAEGRYQPFADLLRRDGYRVEGRTDVFTAESLADIDVLVIANSLAEQNADEWVLPTPSAFTRAEIRALIRWVKNGGALFLIADHMPFPGAAGKLGKALGVRFTNGYVQVPGGAGPLIFGREDGLLAEHSITGGAGGAGPINSIATFTGSAFTGRSSVFEPILVLPPDAISLETVAAGQFSERTPSRAVGGWWQGAVRSFGRGRVAIFGEAAMFTAQLAGPEKIPIGMNEPLARENPHLLLNLLHWLSGGSGT